MLKLNARELLGLKNIKRDDFEQTVKSSFLKVKEHINSIEADVKAGKEAISEKNKEFSSVFGKLDDILVRLKAIEDKISYFESSTGNEGVYSNIHSFTIHSCTQQKDKEKPVIESRPDTGEPEALLEPAAPVQMPVRPQEPVFAPDLTREKPLRELRPKMVKSAELAVISASRQELLQSFSMLSKQELRTFLTIYELSEEKSSNVSYLDVANRLKLSEGCIRTYISGLMRKKIPLEKVKYNNKTVFLQIPREFMDLSLKKDLISMYYETTMPNQKRLGSF